MATEPAYELRRDPAGGRWTLWKWIATDSSVVGPEEVIAATIHLTGEGVTCSQIEGDRWVGDVDDE